MSQHRYRSDALPVIQPTVQSTEGINVKRYDTHTHTHPFNGPFPGLPGSARTRKVKPIWILLEQETVSGNGISWAICKSVPRSRQITMPAPHHSVFFTGRNPFLPPNQQRQGSEGSKLKDTIVPQNINKLLQAAEYNVIQLYQFALKS